MSAYFPKNLKICGGDAFGDSVRSVYIEDLTQWLNMEGDLWLYSTEGFINYYVNGKVSGYQFDVRLGYYRGHYLCRRK